jgi:hypothetical protein
MEELQAKGKNINLNFKPSRRDSATNAQKRKNKQKMNSSITKYSKHAKKEAQVKAKCEKIKANCISYFNGKSENVPMLNTRRYENECICTSTRFRNRPLGSSIALLKRQKPKRTRQLSLIISFYGFQTHLRTCRMTCRVEKALNKH